MTTEPIRGRSLWNFLPFLSLFEMGDIMKQYICKNDLRNYQTICIYSVTGLVLMFHDYMHSHALHYCINPYYIPSFAFASLLHS